jgi:hypothetical protein
MFVAENHIGSVRKEYKQKGRNQMKKSGFISMTVLILALTALALNPASVSGQSNKFSKGSMFITGQIGTNSYVITDESFNSLPFPVGVSYEFCISDNIGIGGTMMYDKWSDYLGMFGGKFTFHVFKPSLDLTYHFNIESVEGFNLFSGLNLGYSLLSVTNNLGNQYIGDLKSEPYIAPFLGAHLYFWENVSGFLNNVLITLKIYWSVTGDFSGVHGAVGITYQIK